MNATFVILTMLVIQLAPGSQIAREPDRQYADGTEEQDTEGAQDWLEDDGADPAESDTVPRPVAMPPPEPSFQDAPVPEGTSPERTSMGGGWSWQAAFAPEHWAVWSLSVVVLAAAIAAIRMVVLLGRQIRAASSPRLYVEGVRFTGLVAASRPVFFARIGNAGPTDATDVTVTISAVYQGGGGKEGAPQKVTIPANGSRELFLRWQTALTSAVREDIRAGSCKLCVKVTVQYGDRTPREQCYQYCSWDDRPEGVPDFVSCDLDSQLLG